MLCTFSYKHDLRFTRTEPQVEAAQTNVVFVDEEHIHVSLDGAQLPPRNSDLHQA